MAPHYLRFSRRAGVFSTVNLTCFKAHRALDRGQNPGSSGLPDWLGTFQNPDFPALFADYARAFAQRFPWVQLYTPVNEMYICAKFSALPGWWNEQLQTDRAFVTALKYLVEANVLAMQAILAVRPTAMFIQSESSEYHHAENIAAVRHAEILNYQRLLSLDLNYGHRVDSGMYEYLMDNGMTRPEYHFFLENKVKSRCIMGNDYYNSPDTGLSHTGFRCVKTF